MTSHAPTSGRATHRRYRRRHHRSGRGAPRDTNSIRPAESAVRSKWSPGRRATQRATGRLPARIRRRQFHYQRPLGHRPVPARRSGRPIAARPMPHADERLVVRDGRLHPVPEGFMLMEPRALWPLVTSPLLSWRGKAACWPSISSRRDSDVQDESLASFAGAGWAAKPSSGWCSRWPPASTRPTLKN